MNLTELKRFHSPLLPQMLCCCSVYARPAPVPAPQPHTTAGRQSELIAGNEFLKLFLDHDEQQRSLRSEEEEKFGEPAGPATARANSARSLEHRTRYRNANAQQHTDGGKGKQVVKLVTTGSKIVFLEDAPTKSTKSSDEVKVVAVSVSSSSKRGGRINRTQLPGTVTASSHSHSPSHSHRSSAPSAAGNDFINRSHKSELSIEETEPRLAADLMDADGDSLNSASNIQNVLASPLLTAAASSRSSSLAFGRNATRINQRANDADTEANTHETPDDKLLPFQTVIYHDTKQGHGPQSRSISYSSISQNVDDLHLAGGGSRGGGGSWHQSAGGSILAEAQRNVSDSLKPMPRIASEPSKFYSLPSKMYSVPAKFYSEPAKVYSEPAKMYGQPEKVYSEPAKVYGQPSKFYSEPAKVYSQPAKVYGEPAKTYWPQTVTTSTTSSPTTTATGTGAAAAAAAATTVTVPPAGAAPTTFVPSRRPAIVSRIAFGEAQTTTTSTTTTTTPTPTTSTTTTNRSIESQLPATSSSSARPSSIWQQHHHQHYHSAHNQHLRHQQQHQQPQQSAGNSQPRRVLFNLDKLPYDLLNAPQPQPARHLLEPILSKSPIASDYQQQQQQYHRPCWEQQQQQQRQHSSLSLQHSNQNAKGLPNRGESLWPVKLHCAAGLPCCLKRRCLMA